MIERGELSLCAVAKISNSLTPKNKSGLLRRVIGKRLRVIDAILAEDKPAAPIRDNVKPTGRIEPPKPPTESDDLFMGLSGDVCVSSTIHLNRFSFSVLLPRLSSFRQ